MVLLTIAIPTYNRSSYLEKQLTLLSKLITTYDFVEILVSDNDSVDSTFNVLSLFSENYKQINFLKQKTNIGFDANIFELYNNANGKFIWFLSDDDFITNNSLESVINIINQFPNLGFATFRGTNKINNSNRFVSFNRIFSFPEEKSLRELFSVICISTLVIKKVNSKIEHESIPKSIYPQLTLALNTLLSYNQFLVVDEQIVTIDPGYVTNDFITLYCINPVIAVNNSNLSVKEKNRLVKILSYSVKEFIKLQFLSRVGFYYTKSPTNFNKIYNLISYYKYNPRVLFYSLFILFFRYLPFPIMSSLHKINLLLKSNFSIRKYKINIRKFKDHKQKILSKFSDV